MMDILIILLGACLILLGLIRLWYMLTNNDNVPFTLWLAKLVFCAIILIVTLKIIQAIEPIEKSDMELAIMLFSLIAIIH
jgi:hypothetical protein